MKAKIMTTAFTAAFLVSLIFANSATAENSSSKAPITRVVTIHHNNTLSDVNVAALRQSGERLKTEHPELAEELEKMAVSALA